MIAAAATTSSSISLNHLPVGWFDITLLVVIGIGFFRGRKNGMSKEVLPMFQWLATVIVCGLGYEMSGKFFMNVASLKILPAFICGYLALAFLVFLLFMPIKKMLVPRLTGSNIFGGMEYYMGTASGMIRFTCILFCSIALLHAPFYSAADIAATTAYNARTFGAGVKGYSGNFFPTIQTVQQGVFKDSFTGPYIERYANVMLVNTTSLTTDSKAPAQNAPVIRIGN